ncbi:hypothetical protein [Candidatus Solincola tengchongensis]|uniref:hypothetical protein n=1 Tax=Candidatus Solincola tengchongensis TaxID=2900693 RepID=UPI00257B7C3D|nr:hypothetical protein [Candidatus Solincola tengchongensis]
MSNVGGWDEGELASLQRIKSEITDFFVANPFLLVSEDWLASLICRPAHLVEVGVRELIAEGVLKKRDRHFLLGLSEGGMAHPDEQRLPKKGGNATP